MIVTISEQVYVWYILVFLNFILKLYSYVTEFWKITHMGARGIIRIFMFSGLLINAGHSFKIFQ